MAADIYLQLEGTTGETKDSAFADAIQILSFSWSAGNATSAAYGTGLAVGKPNLGDVVFSKTMDKASSAMFKHMCTGKHIPSATFTFRKAAGGDTPTPYLVFKFTDVMPSSVSFGDQGSGPGGGTGGPVDLGIETWSLAYVQVDTDYKPIDNAGIAGASVTGGYNVQTNKVS